MSGIASLQPLIAERMRANSRGRLAQTDMITGGSQQRAANLLNTAQFVAQLKAEQDRRRAQMILDQFAQFSDALAQARQRRHEADIATADRASREKLGLADVDARKDRTQVEREQLAEMQRQFDTSEQNRMQESSRERANRLRIEGLRSADSALDRISRSRGGTDDISGTDATFTSLVDSLMSATPAQRPAIMRDIFAIEKAGAKVPDELKPVVEGIFQDMQASNPGGFLQLQAIRSGQPAQTSSGSGFRIPFTVDTSDVPPLLPQVGRFVGQNLGDAARFFDITQPTNPTSQPAMDEISETELLDRAAEPPPSFMDLILGSLRSPRSRR